MKTKRGFTLVELLSVIVILSLTITVGFYAITKSISSSKEKAYQEQINRFINLSKIFITDNLYVLPEKNEIIYVTSEDLYINKLIEDDILNPKTNKELEGCVKVSYDEKLNNHLYQYKEDNECPKGEYTIHYDLSGGILDKPNPTMYTSKTETFTLNNPQKLGYSFNGWKLQGRDELNTSETIYKGSFGDRYYTAVFDLALLIKIDPNGGTYSGETSFFVEPNTTLNKFPDPEKDNWKFIGWKANNEEFTVDENGYITVKSTSITFTAQWINCTIIGDLPNYTFIGDDDGQVGDSTFIDEGDGNWKIRLLESGTLTFNCSENMVDAFLVGGGGGGGGLYNSVAGGGGGGGYTITKKNFLMTNDDYTIAVGAGGIGKPGAHGDNGEMSYIKLGATIIEQAEGGNGGGYSQWEGGGSGGNGGNGGGGGGSNWSDSYGVWGYNGYNGLSYGETGGNKVYTTPYSVKIYNGTGQGRTTCEFDEGTTSGCNDGVIPYAGGGGGGYGWKGAGEGGIGGGGAGGASKSNGNDGIANTGGGGGGGGNYNSSASGGNGGSGIIIIRNAR